MRTKCWSENLKGRNHAEDLAHRWEDNIRMDLSEIGWEGMDWSHLAQDRDQGRPLVNTVLNLWVSKRLRIS